jgi:hypothetical protein
MEQPLLLTVIIAILYFVMKMLEAKYVNKTQEPLKYVVRDTLIVSACSFLVLFLFFQMSGPIVEILGGGEFAGSAATQAFTGEPGF